MPVAWFMNGTLAQQPYFRLALIRVVVPCGL